MKLNLMRIIHMDYERLITLLGSFASGIISVGIPTYFLIRKLFRDERSKSLDLQKKTSTVDFEVKKKAQAITEKEETTILKRMERLMQIERENNERLLERERKANELARQERMEAHIADMDRVVKRLEETEKRTTELELKERACAEFTIKLQSNLEHAIHKGNNQATIILALESKIKSLEDKSWTGQQH